MQRLKKTPLLQRLGQLISSVGAVTLLPLYIGAVVVILLLAVIIL